MSGHRCLPATHITCTPTGDDFKKQYELPQRDINYLGYVQNFGYLELEFVSEYRHQMCRG